MLRSCRAPFGVHPSRHPRLRSARSLVQNMDSFDVELCLIDEEMAAISLHTVTGSGLDSGGFNPVPSFRAVPEGRSNALGLDHRPEFDHADSEEPVDPPARRRAFRTWYAPVIQVASPAHLPSSKRVIRSNFAEQLFLSVHFAPQHTPSPPPCSLTVCSHMCLPMSLPFLQPTQPARLCTAISGTSS